MKDLQSDGGGTFGEEPNARRGCLAGWSLTHREIRTVAAPWERWTWSGGEGVLSASPSSIEPRPSSREYTFGRMPLRSGTETISEPRRQVRDWLAGAGSVGRENRVVADAQRTNVLGHGSAGRSRPGRRIDDDAERHDRQVDRAAGRGVGHRRGRLECRRRL